MPRQTTVPFPHDKTYIKRDLRGGDQIDTSSPYIEDGRIYRDISKYPPLREAVRNGLSQELAKQGYFPSHRVDFSQPTRIQVEFIPWCVYPTEHSLRQSRDGLLQMLELADLLKNDNYSFRDLSWRQVALKYSQLPMLVDMGSIVTPYKSYCDVAMKEFLIWAEKIGMTTKTNSIKGLLKEVAAYYPKSPKDEWDTYDKRGELPDKDNPEIKFISKWVEKLGGGSVLDAGANRGRISKHLACRLGMAVLACDTSDLCVTDLYLWAQKNHMPITSLKWDIMKKPKWVQSYDWMCCDTLIASSLTHHLGRAGHDFVEQEKVFGQVARKLLLLEYIDPRDRHVGRWGVRWTQQEFEAAYSGHKLLEKASLDPQNPHRFWYAYEVCGV